MLAKNIFGSSSSSYIHTVLTFQILMNVTKGLTIVTRMLHALILVVLSNVVATMDTKAMGVTVTVS